MRKFATVISCIGYLIVPTATTFQIDKGLVPIVSCAVLRVALIAGVRLAGKRAPSAQADNIPEPAFVRATTNCPNNL